MQKPSLPSVDDYGDGDIYKEGRDDIMIMSSINAVDIHCISWSPASDIQVETVDVHQDDDDPDAIRAQVDTGAHVSCTDQLHLLHGYREFTQSRPNPVKLMPATVNSDAVPNGVGYLHVPAKNAQGCLAAQTFYTSCICTAVIDERDLVKAAKINVKDMQSDSITKHKDAGTFTYHAKHCMKANKDVIVHGILMDDKCCAGAPIPPDLSPSDPKATPSTSSILAIESDPDFAEQCDKATFLAVHGHHEAVETPIA